MKKSEVLEHLKNPPCTQGKLQCTTCALRFLPTEICCRITIPAEHAREAISSEIDSCVDPLKFRIHKAQLFVLQTYNNLAR